MTLGKNWYINTSTEFDDFFSALTAMDSLTLLEEKIFSISKKELIMGMRISLRMFKRLMESKGLEVTQNYS